VRALVRVVVLASFAAVAVAAAAEPKPVIQGSWIATAGPKQFRGQWSAQVLPDNANSAVGSWTLLNEANVIALGGTWTAKKAPKGWRGTWTARVQNGPSFAGTWEADARNLTGKTFEDMLKQSATAQIGGWWHMGKATGNWWIQSLTKAGP
jgi:hypothetical protein